MAKQIHTYHDANLFGEGRLFKGVARSDVFPKHTHQEIQITVLGEGNVCG